VQWSMNGNWKHNNIIRITRINIIIFIFVWLYPIILKKIFTFYTLFSVDVWNRICVLTLCITCKIRFTCMEKRLTPFTFQFAPYLLQTVGWDVFSPTDFTFDMKGHHHYVVENLMKWKRKNTRLSICLYECKRTEIHVLRFFWMTIIKKYI